MANKVINTADAQELVNILNDRYYEMTTDVVAIPFSFSTNGHAEIILFFDYPIWSSECDGYEDEDETLADKVFGLFKDHLERLTSFAVSELFHGKQWD
jgi:hypothetical protein